MYTFNNHFWCLIISKV